MHLEVLAALPELLHDDEFRRTLVKADHARDIKPLLVERAGQQPQRRSQPAEIPRQRVAVARHAVGLAESLSAQAILLAIDQGQSVPSEPLKSWPGRLLVISSKNSDEGILDRPDTHLFDGPHASLSRMDGASLGLLLGAAKGLVDHEREVVCITGWRGQALDSKAKPGGPRR